MLGLADFFKAVRGSVALRLRRAHPLTGPALMVLLWVLALGSLFWVAQDDDEPAGDRPPRAERDDETAATAADPADPTTIPPADSEAADTVTADPAGSTGGLPLVDGAEPTDPDVEVLEGPTRTTAPLSPTASETRPSTRAEPSRDTTTTSSTAPTASRPPTTSRSPTTARPPAATTTTTPPDDGGGIVGGLLGGLLDLLGL